MIEKRPEWNDRGLWRTEAEGEEDDPPLVYAETPLVQTDVGSKNQKKKKKFCNFVSQVTKNGIFDRK